MLNRTIGKPSETSVVARRSDALSDSSEAGSYALAWLTCQVRNFNRACELSTPLVVIASFGIVGLLLASHLSLSEDGDGLLATVMSLQKVHRGTFGDRTG